MKFILSEGEGMDGTVVHACVISVPILLKLHEEVWFVLVSQASPILFRSTDRFQYRHAEEGSGDLGPLFVDLYGNLNRANEIEEHIIRADFVT